MDLRTRILKACDRGEQTQEQIARRFCVSHGLVKKLLSQRRRTGSIEPRYRFCGRKPVILPAHRKALRALVGAEPDLTLEELRTRLGLPCTVQAIHYVLAGMGMTYKKRHSEPASKAGPTSSKRAVPGGGDSQRSTPQNSSSSTKRRPKRT
ncbi:MAG TPA: hypothetical protein VHM91_14690 [Verrucomicrobiales bacterium]|nr:hypothetical protein [Verrucomicrobiales bacterium]